MDHHFDQLTRSLAALRSRRGLLGTLGFGAIAMPWTVEAKKTKKGKKRKKRKKKRGANPPPPGATCADGVRNGRETDVDCGGPDCPRCGDGRSCQRNTDCDTARCGNARGEGSACQTCNGDGLCGEDANGLCECDLETGICFTDRLPDQGDFADECPVCPAETTCRSFGGAAVCWPLCGG